MLLKRSELEAILSGSQSLVIRRWKRPTVKSGGRLKTAIGELAIDRVSECQLSSLTARDAAAAGHDSLADLISFLQQREGSIYKIELHFAGEDPRIALRESSTFTDAEFEELCKRLDHLDTTSKFGRWTREILQAIDEQPHQAAAQLAETTGYEKGWLKVNIRKLKNIGLTVSHQPGYELSKRGRAFLRRLQRTGRTSI